jgi:hypothetical protein
MEPLLHKYTLSKEEKAKGKEGNINFYGKRDTAKAKGGGTYAIPNGELRLFYAALCNDVRQARGTFKFTEQIEIRVQETAKFFLDLDVPPGVIISQRQWLVVLLCLTDILSAPHVLGRAVQGVLCTRFHANMPDSASGAHVIFHNTNLTLLQSWQVYGHVMHGLLQLLGMTADTVLPTNAEGQVIVYFLPATGLLDETATLDNISEHERQTLMTEYHTLLPQGVLSLTPPPHHPSAVGFPLVKLLDPKPLLSRHLKPCLAYSEFVHPDPEYGGVRNAAAYYLPMVEATVQHEMMNLGPQVAFWKFVIPNWNHEAVGRPQFIDMLLSLSILNEQQLDPRPLWAVMTLPLAEPRGHLYMPQNDGVVRNEAYWRRDRLRRDPKAAWAALPPPPQYDEVACRLYIDRLLALKDESRLQMQLICQNQQERVELLRRALLDHTRTRFGEDMASMASRMVVTNPKHTGEDMVADLPQPSWFFKNVKKAQAHYHLVMYSWAEVKSQPIFPNLLALIRSFAPQEYATLPIQQVCLAFAIQNDQLGFIYFDPSPKTQGGGQKTQWPCVNNQRQPHHGEQIYFELNVTGHVLHALCRCKCLDKCGRVVVEQHLTDAALKAQKRSCAMHEVADVVQLQLQQFATALHTVIQAMVLADAPPSTTLLPALLEQSQRILTSPCTPQPPQAPPPSLHPPLHPRSSQLTAPPRRPRRRSSPPPSPSSPPLFTEPSSPVRRRSHDSGFSPPPQRRCVVGLAASSFVPPASRGAEVDLTQSKTARMLADPHGGWGGSWRRLTASKTTLPAP